jgi:hypothetical protein
VATELRDEAQPRGTITPEGVAGHPQVLPRWTLERTE